MESFSKDTESPVLLTKRTTTTKKKKEQRRGVEESWPKKKGGGGVALEGYLEPADCGSDRGSDSSGDLVGRTKSLTDEDLEELKGCLDLGFGFSYDEIPELCSTLPALELCYSMSQRFQDEHHQQQRSPPDSAADAPAAPVANWRFSSPGTSISISRPYFFRKMPFGPRSWTTNRDYGPRVSIPLSSVFVWVPYRLTYQSGADT
ncbi:Uncharacterized protein M6B38_228585 [Iris pallida]|uniref:Uncharacterized protein n=1 Tax=Iris pallida TaxID=29817 RepID=A0AAX6DT74_IRIPA|nr:Uncharacterized protein M6B38_228585 [Iris pallida]